MRKSVPFDCRRALLWLVVLSGVVRPIDIQPGNVIPSTMVGQLRIRSLSAGLVKDSLTPGWLIRALNKVF